MNPTKHICPLCDYIYDDSKGDPDLGISPGTNFDQLPDDFRHPDCSAVTAMFETCTCVQVESSAELAKRDLSRQALSALISKYPKFSQVFDKYGLDYCCNGNTSLSDACHFQELETEEVVDELIKASIGICQTKQSEESIRSVIREIVSEHHSHLADELPEISLMLEALLSKHGKDTPPLDDIASSFQKLRDQLEQHIEKERTILFPLCVDFDEHPIPLRKLRDPIGVLEHEHFKIHSSLRKIRMLINENESLPDRCDQYSKLINRLRKFESGMHLHIHKENNLLFPMVIEKALLAELKAF